MAPGDDQGEATSIQAMLAEIFEKTVNPQLARAVAAAESATARAEVAEARCARIEAALQKKSRLSEFEFKQLKEMVNASLENLKPGVDRVMKVVEETVRKNTILAYGIMEVHDENVRLKSASISSIGKPS
jgi:uncharacterized protein YicC (UPF0701 family)